MVEGPAVPVNGVITDDGRRWREISPCAVAEVVPGKLMAVGIWEEESDGS